MSLSAEARRERAFALAYRYLARRDRTVTETRAQLSARGVDRSLVDELIDELTRQGYLDDARYARRFAEDRRSLDGWGSERIERRLLATGIAPELIAAALADHRPEDELAGALALLARRLPAPPRDDSERARALGLLLRRGYALELAHDALRAHASEARSTAER
jgi:regulatory protein